MLNQMFSWMDSARMWGYKLFFNKAEPGSHNSQLVQSHHHFNFY